MQRSFMPCARALQKTRRRTYIPTRAGELRGSKERGLILRLLFSLSSGCGITCAVASIGDMYGSDDSTVETP